MVKLDPYLNVDAGTMSPYEHGECYVLDDGTEVDLDLGTYERFLDIRLSGKNSITSGKVYSKVLAAERRGDYLGKTVQVVPHVTDEILRQIKDAAGNEVDVCMLELGGTVGDIEGMVFLEALRQLRAECKYDFCHIHVSLVPKVNEQKSKPTQHSFKELRHAGLSPDFIFCRCEEEVNETVRQKISAFCMVPEDHVISVHDVSNVYSVPKLLADQDVPEMVIRRLDVRPTKDDLSPFSRIQEYKGGVTIAIIGKYTYLHDAYLSIHKALFHAGQAVGIYVDIEWVDCEEQDDFSFIDECIDGVIVPGGFGVRGAQGKIDMCKYARENQIPFLGICFGFQLAVIEYLRNVKKLDARSEEIDESPPSWHKIDGYAITKVDNNDELGGTMVKGLQTFTVKKGSKLHKLYGANIIRERCRHRYEVNEEWVEANCVDSYWQWTCSNKDEKEAFAPVEWEIGPPPYPCYTGERMEAFEIPTHPFYIGVQYHPEFLSRFTKPHPLFVGLIEAARERTRPDLVKT
jgi:CTP synthase